MLKRFLTVLRIHSLSTESVLDLIYKRFQARLNGGISMQIDLMLYAYDTRRIDSLHAIDVQSIISNNSLKQWKYEYVKYMLPLWL